MMKTHRSSRLRLLGGGAAVVALAAISLTFGTASVAHPHPEGAKQGGQQRERIVIMETKDGGHRRDGAHAEHFRRIIRHGEDGEVIAEGCRGGSDELVNVNEGEEANRTRIIICGEGGESSAARLEHLERARERLAENDALSSEHRQRVLEAIDRAIARARAQ